MRATNHRHPLVVKIRKTAFVMDKIAGRTLTEKFGMSFSQFLILATLAHHPSATQKAIAEARDVTEAAVSRLVDQLRRSGKLRRVKNPKSRREHILTLTPEGRRTLAKAGKVVEKRLDAYFAPLTAEERRVMEGAFDKVMAAFHADCERSAAKK
jgi:DNA-binding MarR family transcriptional regulator